MELTVLFFFFIIFMLKINKYANVSLNKQASLSQSRI